MSMHYWIGGGVAALSLSCVLSPVVEAAPVRYTVTGLGSVAGFGASEAYDINDSGVVVGRLLGSAENGFVWSASGGMERTFINGSPTGAVVSINNNGTRLTTTFVGGTNGPSLALIRGDGSAHIGGTLAQGGYGVIPRKLNNSDIAVGFYFDSGFSIRPFRYDMNAAAGSRLITPTGNANSRIYGIADDGTMVGQMGSSNQPARWSADGTIGAAFFNVPNPALAINPSFNQPGAVSIITGGGYAGNDWFIRVGNTTTRMPNLYGGTYIEPSDVNDAGVIVGGVDMAFADASMNRGFVHVEGVTYDLDTLIDTPGWHIGGARGINSLGQIVGYGYFDGVKQAVLLTPVAIPEPGALVGFVAVPAGMLLRRRRD